MFSSDFAKTINSGTHKNRLVEPLRLFERMITCQSMLMSKTKKMYRPCEPIIHYIKVGVRGSALHGYASMMRRR